MLSQASLAGPRGWLPVLCQSWVTHEKIIVNRSVRTTNLRVRHPGSSSRGLWSSFLWNWWITPILDDNGPLPQPLPSSCRKHCWYFCSSSWDLVQSSPSFVLHPQKPGSFILGSCRKDCMLYLYSIYTYVYIHSEYDRYLWSNHCRCLHITCSHHSARLKLPSKRYLARCTSLCPQVRASLMIMSGFDLPPQKGGAPVALSKRLGEIFGKLWETHAKGTCEFRCQRLPTKSK